MRKNERIRVELRNKHGKYSQLYAGSNLSKAKKIRNTIRRLHPKTQVILMREPHDFQEEWSCN